MADNLQKLIQLAKADGGKFFVIDEKGEPSLVIMGIDDYENILLKKVQNQLEDIEAINQKIIEAQKAEMEVQRKNTAQEDLVSEVIDSTFSFEPEIPMSQQRAELEDI
jgi:hypothetical protein